AQEMDFEFVFRNDFVVTQQDAQVAKKQMEDENVDFLLVQSTSFSSGYLIQQFAQASAFLGLWAVPESTKYGPLPLNSFCNMNLNMSQLDRFLSYLKKDAKWFYGYPKDEIFKKRFTTTLRALRAIKNIFGSRFLLIGGRAPGFDNLFYDPRILKEKLRISVDEMEFGDLKTRFLSHSSEQLRDLIAEIELNYTIKDEYAKNSLEKMARLILTVRQLKEEGNYDGFAISCWPRFRIELGMVPCASYAFLSDEMNTTVCEGDVISLVSMKILEYIADYPAILMDLSDVDFSDNSIFLWHCGIGSKFYAKDKKIELEKHFNPGPKDPEKGWLTMAPVASMKFLEIPVTISRITNNLNEYFVLTGEFFDSQDKPDYDGSRGWLGKLKFFEEDITTLDLINTIMVNKIEHHFPLVKGNYTSEIIEFMNWLGFDKIPKIQYKDYYQRRHR
ncbi:MAG: hypothetical protein ABDH59_09860, partial [Fervidobacterium sp.]